MNLLGTNPYYGTSWDDDLKASALMMSLGDGASLGVMGSDIQTPEDLLELTRAAEESGMSGMGQFSYYGSQTPGGAPVKSTEWDKFMQFNNAVMPALSNILGTFIQGRYQAQSAQTMADAFKGMNQTQQSSMMQAYMVNQMMAQQGLQPQMSQQQMNNMGQAFGMMPSSQFNSAFGGAMGNLGQAAGGNASLLALLNQQGKVLKSSVTGSIPVWAIVAGIVGAGAVVYFGFIAPNQ